MALRILNQNHLSLVKTVRHSTVPLCRRLRCRCMSTTQTAAASKKNQAEDPTLVCHDAAELQRRILVRPMSRRYADELQPQNLPEYGQQQQWATEEHLRLTHGEVDYIAVLPHKPILKAPRRSVQDHASPFRTQGSRAYSTFARRLRVLNTNVVHPERPLALTFTPMATIPERGIAIGTHCHRPAVGESFRDHTARDLGEQQQQSAGVMLDQTRGHHHKSHRKKTTKRILEEWNRRSSQDYLRIDNILYKYKRKELAKKGLLIEDCPKDKKKQRGGGKDKKHPHGKKSRKGKKKKKKPGCKNKKLRVKCAALEENTERERKIDEALDELVGPASAVEAPPPAPPVTYKLVRTRPSRRKHDYALGSALTRNETLNYIVNKNNQENQALDALLNSAPACFAPAQGTSTFARPFSTTTAPEAPYESSLQQLNTAYASVEEDVADLLEERIERADDCMELDVKPLPVFKPMKLPAEAKLPPPTLAEVEPLPRLRKRTAMYEEC